MVLLDPLIIDETKGFMEREPRLVWIDLEMTGLDPEKNVITEIATIITDNNLTILEEGPSFAIKTDQALIDAMSPEVKKIYSKSDLIERIQKSTITMKQAEDETVQFIKEHCTPGLSPLCGNSIYMDRMFLQKHMPRVIELLHYRIIDVSSVKEIVNRWYPNDPETEFPKAETHRALTDIRESIAELKHYRKCFFV